MQTVDWGKRHLNVIYSLVTCSENDANDCSISPAQGKYVLSCACMRDPGEISLDVACHVHSSLAADGGPSGRDTRANIDGRDKPRPLHDPTLSGVKVTDSGQDRDVNERLNPYLDRCVSRWCCKSARHWLMAVP